MTPSSPSPVFRLVKTIGLPSRMARGVAIHHREVGADERREVGLVDDQQIAARDAGAPLARHLVAAGDVHHVDADVHELRAERRREVVAAGFEEHDLHVGERRDGGVDRFLVDGRVFADGGVRAAAGLHAANALARQRAGSHQELGVLVGVDVVGDDRDAVAVAQPLAQAVEQRRLARPDRAADPDCDSTHWRLTLRRCRHATPIVTRQSRSRSIDDPQSPFGNVNPNSGKAACAGAAAGGCGCRARASR